MEMNMQDIEQIEIFLMTSPGHEAALAEEVRTKGFKRPQIVAGGVIVKGTWSDVWRANLWLRGAGRVLARIASFRVLHLAQLEARARKVPWGDYLRAEIPFRVEVTCRKSRIYHSDAAAQRIAGAISDVLGAKYDDQAEVLVKARIENDMCTVSLDTSGELLHKRGFKEAVNQAPMRETMASLFLRQCGYDGTEPVLDPMCGSGTFVIEAAEIAAGLNPGRMRRFAFELFANFDPKAWDKMRAAKSRRHPIARYYGRDRDAGAVAMSEANAARAGVAAWTEFEQCPISELTCPAGPAGLVIINPPYGTRIGDKKKLSALYRAMGQTLLSRFKGWRVGIITTDASLARATGLPFLPVEEAVQHGGLRVTLYCTNPLD